VHGVLALLCSVSLLSLTTGGVRQFDRPEYVEIDTSETGFLIPLEGDSTEQVKFQSEDYLKQHKVATKRVQITHRWSQEGAGRLMASGSPTVRLVKVNRSPVTRRMDDDAERHASARCRQSEIAKDDCEISPLQTNHLDRERG